MVKNAGSKNKHGRLMKNMKSSNSGLSNPSMLLHLQKISSTRNRLKAIIADIQC